MGRAARTAGRKRRRPTAANSASASTASAPWDLLPEDLLLLVLDRLPSVVDLVAFAAVCRSWRALAAAAPTASASVGGGRPPLLLTPVLDSVSGLSPLVHPLFPDFWTGCRLRSPTDPTASYRCFVPPSALTCSPFLGYSHGQLIFCPPLLADIVTGAVLRPPELPGYLPLDHGVLTAPLSAPDCHLLLTGGSFLLRWRVGGEQGYSVHTLSPGMLGESRITVFGGQVLILDLHGPEKLLMVKFSPSFSVRELAFQRTWGISVPLRLSPFPPQLVECGGELLLVHCVRPVVAGDYFHLEVEVLRLDLSEPPSWVKVESLGEAALFINVEHGISVSCLNPSRWGGRSNCIYLALRSSYTWALLPLDGKLINVADPQSPFYWLKKPSDKQAAPIWVYPSMLH